MTELVIETTDKKSISISRDLIMKYSILVANVIEDDPEAKSVELNISSQHFDLIKEYIEHHGAGVEAGTPVPPIAIDWTLEKALPDKWDAEFLTRCQTSLEDHALIEFSNAVSYLGMDALVKKVTLAIAITLVATHGLQADKLATAFNKMVVKETQDV